MCRLRFIAPPKHAEELAEERSIDRQAEAQHERKGQHPLAVGGFGQEIVDKVGRDVGHAPADTARAEPALAAEGDQALEAALGATQAGEAPRQKPAPEIAGELALDEGR